MDENLDNGEKKNEILKRIKELIPDAPYFWKETIATKMGKSTESVTKYVTGGRGMKVGHHKEVLRLLKEIVEEENQRIKKLLK